MKKDNPYRARGTLGGLSYIERKADTDLRDAILYNNSYPFLLAPRQSGKSSLMEHTRRFLATVDLRIAIVDLSIFPKKVQDDFDHFMLHFVSVIAEKLGESDKLEGSLDQLKHGPLFLLDFIHLLLETSTGRIVVCIDELDALSSAEFKDDFLSQIRSLFNERASDPIFNRIQFMLAAAISRDSLISQPKRSPFNVGEAIVLSDFNKEQIKKLITIAEWLDHPEIEGASERVCYWTSGSVFLSQNILEKAYQLQLRMNERRDICELIDDIVREIIHSAPLEIHFRNIEKQLREQPLLLSAWKGWINGKEPEMEIRERLFLTGISDGENPIRNRIYREIFVGLGPLHLVPETSKDMENPFIFGRCVYGNEFVGRTKSIDEMLDLMRKKIPISLVAEHRLGKTSLLKHICHSRFRNNLKAKVGDVLVIYINFEKHSDLTAEKFWRLIIEEATSQAKDMPKNIKVLLSKMKKAGTSNFEELVIACLKSSIKIVLLFDEFEYVSNSASMDLPFFGRLRNLVSIDMPIACVIATRRALSEIDKFASNESGVLSPFFNVFLGPFEDAEANALILSSLSKTTIKFDSDDLKFLHELSGYHPFFLQMAAYYLFEEKSVQSERKNDEIRRCARRQFDDQCRDYFEFYWKNSDHAEKVTMKAYAFGRPPISRSSESTDRKMTIVNTNAVKSLIDRGLLVKDSDKEDLIRLMSSSLASHIRVNYLGELHNVPELPQNFLPRDNQFKKLKKALFCTLMEQNSPSSSRKIGIYGMGGVGKSVFSAALARDEEVQSSFFDGIIWVCLGQQPNLTQGQSRILNYLGADEDISDIQDGLNRLGQLLKDRSCLLILDDVWKMEDLNAFNALGPKCSMLITTRDQGIVRNLGAREFPIDVLSEEESTYLLSLWSGQSSDTLPSEAKEIANECNNLPLALAMVGAMAKGKPGPWRNILNKLKSANLEKIHADFPSYLYPNLRRAFEVSVKALNPEEERHYLELAVFQEDTHVPLAALQVLWDMDEYDAKDMIDLLADRSLARIEGSMLSLHDLQHDFVVMKAGDLKSLHKQFLDAYMRRCMQGWPSGPNDGYFFQYLAYHLSEAGRLEDLKSLLFDFNWIRAKLKACEKVSPVVSDYEFALPHEDVEILQLQKAIRFSANVLDKDQSQLPSQLFGRLTGIDSQQIQALLNQALETTSKPWLRSRTHGLISSSRGISAVVFTPDNRKAITGSSYRAIEVWDLETGKKDRILKGHTKGISSVAVSSDGLRAVSGSSDHSIKVWDLENCTVIKTLKGHSDTVFSVAVSQDGQKAISGSNDRTIKVWNLKTYKKIGTLEGHTDSIFSVAIFPDGQRAVSGSDDRTIKVWNLETGKEIRTLKGHTDWISAVAVSSDGRRVVSGSWDHTAKVWDLETGKEISTLKGHNHEVSAVAVSPDGRRVVSGSWDHTAKVWDLVTGKEILTFRGHNREVGAVAVSPDCRRVVSGSWDHTAKVWDLETGKEILTLKVHTITIGVSAIAVSLDGRRAISGSSDGIITIWGADGKAGKSFDAHTDHLIYSIALTADGRKAISGSSDNTIKVWDLETGQMDRTLKGHTNGISAIVFTPDGQKAVSGSSDGTITLWDLEVGKEIRTLKGHTKEIRVITIAPGGKRAVSVSDDDSIKVWDLETGLEMRTLKGHAKGVNAVAVTPDGQKAVWGSSDGTINIWDLEKGKKIRTLKVHKSIVFAIAVFQDNRTAISGSDDGTIKIWDLETKDIITTFSGGSMTAVAVAKDEINIIAGDNEGRTHFLVLEKHEQIVRGDYWENIGVK